MTAASPEAVAAKLREMGMPAADAERIASGEGLPARSTLSVDHRASIADTKRRRIAERAEAVARAPVEHQPPRTIVREASVPLPRAPLCDVFGIVAEPGLHGVSIAKLRFGRAAG